MRELDRKEDWAPKNWCFQIVVLEIFESPLESKGERGRLQWCTERGQEELPNVRGPGQKLVRPHTQGQGQRPTVPGYDGAGTAKRSYPTSEVRGGGREELPRIRGQGQWPRGATPRPGSSGCASTGVPRGAIPRSRSGGAAVRRYPSSKVRSSSCVLLEQPWRDTPCTR